MTPLPVVNSPSLQSLLEGHFILSVTEVYVKVYWVGLVVTRRRLTRELMSVFEIGDDQECNYLDWITNVPLSMTGIVNHVCPLLSVVLQRNQFQRKSYTVMIYAHFFVSATKDHQYFLTVFAAIVIPLKNCFQKIADDRPPSARQASETSFLFRRQLASSPYQISSNKLLKTCSS